MPRGPLFERPHAGSSGPVFVLRGDVMRGQAEGRGQGQRDAGTQGHRLGVRAGLRPFVPQSLSPYPGGHGPPYRLPIRRLRGFPAELYAGESRMGRGSQSRPPARRSRVARACGHAKGRGGVSGFLTRRARIFGFRSSSGQAGGAASPPVVCTGDGGHGPPYGTRRRERRAGRLRYGRDAIRGAGDGQGGPPRRTLSATTVRRLRRFRRLHWPESASICVICG